MKKDSAKAKNQAKKVPPYSGVSGYIVFNAVGDVWMAAHSKERLQEFVEQHPWMKLTTIDRVGHQAGDVKMLKSRALRQSQAEAVKAIK